jgi:hypothetical protein
MLVSGNIIKVSSVHDCLPRADPNIISSYRDIVAFNALKSSKSNHYFGCEKLNAQPHVLCKQKSGAYTI